MTDLRQAQEATALTLHNIVDSTSLTHLTLPEKTALVDEIARLLPAGNVPSMVAAGLLRQPGNTSNPAEHRRNLTLLMQGMHTYMDRAVYQTFYAGPAAVLTAYQLILKLAGKDPLLSFPEGTWQFYVEFGLREDTGRHACETVGFHNTVAHERLPLDEADALAAWLLTATWLLGNYETLLAAEWTERVQLRQLAVRSQTDLINQWIARKPYSVPATETKQGEYLEYRAKVFQRFMQESLNVLSPAARAQFSRDWDSATAWQQRSDLVAYQKQLSIRAALQPSEFNDTRVPLSVAELCVGIIHGGRYYLMRALNDNGTLLDPLQIRLVCAAILDHQTDEPPAELDLLLAGTHRYGQATLRRLIPEESRADFEALRRAAILINWDETQPSSQPISQIRYGRRGVGDQALTIFRTSESFVFDVSHIFFDGPWGLAVAEIATGQAIRYARQITRSARPSSASVRVRALHLSGSAKLVRAAQPMTLMAEVSAETTLLELAPIQKVRSLLSRRNEALRLTVNDFLLLYRSLFGANYQPTPAILNELAEMERGRSSTLRKAAQLARKALDQAQQSNPALLIPMDATQIDPRERIYPTTFRNPFSDLMTKHRQVLDAQRVFTEAPKGDRAKLWTAFEDARREYLGVFSLFGELMIQYKDMTMQGESVSTTTIKLLGGLPNGVKRMLDSLPDRFDVVNDMVKGQEVFSNVGRVSAVSSLRRFITAKDDNEKKTLAWGVMTDAQGVMHLSLRDFRPHVAVLIEVERTALAQRMTQDYVDSYAVNLNTYMNELTSLIGLRRPNG